MTVFKFFKTLTLIASLFLLIPQNSQAQTDINSAYSLFLYNFAKYSQWPAGNTGSFKITVLGDSKVYDELSKISQSKNINGRKIEVVKINTPDQIENTDLLFVAQDQSAAIASVQSKTSGKPVLIVAEKMGLFEKGACISFYVGSDSKLKFQINDAELAKRNLKMAQSLKNMAFKG